MASAISPKRSPLPPPKCCRIRTPGRRVRNSSRRDASRVGIDAIGDQDEVDVGIGEEGAGLIGIGAANGMVVGLFIFIEKT